METTLTTTTTTKKTRNDENKSNVWMETCGIPFLSDDWMSWRKNGIFFPVKWMNKLKAFVLMRFTSKPRKNNETHCFIYFPIDTKLFIIGWRAMLSPLQRLFSQPCCGCDQINRHRNTLRKNNNKIYKFSVCIMSHNAIANNQNAKSMRHIW